MRSRIRAWLREEDGWGLHVVDGALILLGTVPGGIETKIAKFEFGSGPDWHGYPANPMRKADVPPARLLGSWVKDNLIKKYQMARLLRGTPCGL